MAPTPAGWTCTPEKIEEEDIQQGQEYWIKKGEPLTIYSDSQATLKALIAVEVKSRLTLDTIDALNQLTRKLDTQVIDGFSLSHVKLVQHPKKFYG